MEGGRGVCSRSLCLARSQLSACVRLSLLLVLSLSPCLCFLLLFSALLTADLSLFSRLCVALLVPFSLPTSPPRSPSFCLSSRGPILFALSLYLSLRSCFSLLVSFPYPMCPFVSLHIILSLNVSIFLTLSLSLHVSLYGLRAVFSIYLCIRQSISRYICSVIHLSFFLLAYLLSLFSLSTSSTSSFVQFRISLPSFLSPLLRPSFLLLSLYLLSVSPHPSIFFIPSPPFPTPPFLSLFLSSSVHPPLSLADYSLIPNNLIFSSSPFFLSCLR